MRKGSAQAGDSGKKKLRIEYRAVDSLVPYARNARTHSDLQIDQVVASIREFGWTNPVLLDGENGIIAGHARVEAAKRIGLTDIPASNSRGCRKHRNALISLRTISWRSTRDGTRNSCGSK